MQELKWINKHLLVGNERNAPADKQRYYAFPSLLQVDENRILITYKNGDIHFKDNEAAIDCLTWDPRNKSVTSIQTVDSSPDRINQNPELIRMANGDLLIFDDVQKPYTKDRLGLRIFRSTDQGASFQDEGDFPQVGDYKYGYAFDAAIQPDGTAMLLAMSFPELTGGERAVHVLSSIDHGRSWTYVRNLNREFAFAMNESTLLAYEGGYLVVARGDQAETKLFRTNAQFEMIQQQSSSIQYAGMDNIGRPELFKVQDTHYILCRNVAKGQDKGVLHLYQMNPVTLELESDVVLHRNDSICSDSYYAVHYFSREGDRTIFNVVTYVAPSPQDKPEIVCMEYDWEELKQLMSGQSIVNK
jgi:hypothetical protein